LGQIPTIVLANKVRNLVIWIIIHLQLYFKHNFWTLFDLFIFHNNFQTKYHFSKIYNRYRIE
jgi:hypothetical protein